MIANFRTAGNGKSIALSKPALAQAGLAEERNAEVIVENVAIVQRKPSGAP